METQQIQIPGFSGGNEPNEQLARKHDLIVDTPMDQDAKHDEIPECECGVQVCNSSRLSTCTIAHVQFRPQIAICVTVMGAAGDGSIYGELLDAIP